MSGEAEAFSPNIIGPELRSRGNGILILFVVAKLKQGVPLAQARAEMQVIQDRIARQNPGWSGFYSGSELRVVPLRERLVGESRRTLLVLLAAVGFVLLIACANLGNLLLARATARQREIAIRAAIGAGRGRLVRQFLAEGLTLALAGGAAGLALARGADALLVRLSPAAVPRLGEVGIDWRVLGFALGISVVAGAVFGLAPALTLATGSLYGVLKEGGRGSAGPGQFARAAIAGGGRTGAGTGAAHGRRTDGEELLPGCTPIRRVSSRRRSGSCRCGFRARHTGSGPRTRAMCGGCSKG